LKKNYKISVITPTFNSEKTIFDNLQSVANQNYSHWEQIIIDNLSEDKTLNIISHRKSSQIRIFSQKDKGIYDAINKGISFARGDIISILNSDDFFYSSKVLSQINNSFNENNVDAVYGDLIYVSRNNKNTLLRYWKSNNYYKNSFIKGWSPPHPSFFVKKNFYKSFGNYKINLGNSADFELMFRFFEKNNIKNFYVNKIFVAMRSGGSSNKDLLTIIKQNLIILEILNIKYNPLKLIIFFYSKFIERFIQFIRKKN
jgi:glycosyltransferase involved in cell wall biosynthesis